MTEPTEDLVRASAEKALGETVVAANFVALNSNHLYRLETASGARYSLRVPRLRPTALSPFWQYMQDTFGLRYGSQLLSVDPILRAIDEDGLLEAPCPIAATTVGDRPAYIFTWVEGTSWEPDEFPDSGEVHERLGEYVARLHLRTHDKYGTLTEQAFDPVEFVARTNANLRHTISRFWTHRPDIGAWFERHATAMDPDVFTGHLAPIMPDISGNQFVYRDGTPAGVVDLDSYVVGPRELELAVVETCLTRPEDFRRGYESVLPLPRFEEFRAYCRFWMLVCEGGGDPDVDEFLTCRTYFA
ncbi:phosphotransferase [Actinopolymorpha rutila]|uniref:Ser/Thr protein kinase RdoA (MazF antagonist) n=1 Tax=Actinopolymorpha rutila TaxID=446787 RepID=A0A852ZK74_9ACTN|nr:phosphotransferase [Actinopolymorpha rutila]NYH93471.1 Ser/Thr protein kinase RdoA (MazF antagonist) [Actinopolymorpha rutila]